MVMEGRLAEKQKQNKAKQTLHTKPKAKTGRELYKI